MRKKSGRGKSPVMGIIMIFIALLVGILLLPAFAAEQAGAYNNTATGAGANVTGGAHSIVGLLTLFFALILLVAAVKWGLGKG